MQTSAAYLKAQCLRKGMCQGGKQKLNLELGWIGLRVLSVYLYVVSVG